MSTGMSKRYEMSDCLLQLSDLDAIREGHDCIEPLLTSPILLRSTIQPSHQSTDSGPF